MRSFLERKIIIAILFFAGLSLAIIFGIIFPTVKYIRQIDRETYNLRLTLERKNERAASYKNSLKQMERIKQEMPVFGNYLFRTGQELTLITTLENLAQKTGVSQKVNSSNLDTLSGQKLLMSVTVSGQYNKILNYLNELEHLPYFIYASSIQLSTAVAKNISDSQQVNMNLDLRLYVSP